MNHDGDGDVAATIRSCLDALNHREAWPAVIEHGDLAPWNIISTPSGLYAFDWEDGRLDGFPGFDIVHYVIQTGALMHKWTAHVIQQYALGRLEAMGYSQQEANSILILAVLRDLLLFDKESGSPAQNIRRQILTEINFTV